MLGNLIQTLVRSGISWLSLAVVWIFLFQHTAPTTEGWYTTARGVNFLQGNWKISVPDWTLALYPLSDVMWGGAFLSGGGNAIWALVILLQLALLLFFLMLDDAYWKSEGALLFLPMVLPGLLTPGCLSFSYLFLAALFLFGIPKKHYIDFLIQIGWFLFAPFSWVFSWCSVRDTQKWNGFRILAVVFALISFVKDIVFFKEMIFGVQDGLWKTLFVFDTIKVVYILLGFLVILSLIRFASIFLVDRSREWSFLFGLGRVILVGLVILDGFYFWQILSPAPSFQPNWREHKAFQLLAEDASNTPDGIGRFTFSPWVHAHCLLEPKLRKTLLISKAQGADSLIGAEGGTQILVGQSSPRNAAAELLGVLEMVSKFSVVDLCGTVAILEKSPKTNDQKIPFRGGKRTLDPASEACLSLAWYEALVNPNRKSVIRDPGAGKTVLTEIQTLGQKRADLGIQNGNQSGLAWAIKAEWILVRHLLENNQTEIAPFEESFRMGQACYCLRRSLAIDPGDFKTRNILMGLLLRQNALDSAGDWDSARYQRRLGRSAGFSLEEWKVFDRRNELAFRFPLSEGKSLARLRESIRLGLKALALQELAESDPVLFGPTGLRTRLDLLFSLGYIQDASEFLQNLKEARIANDLGLQEWNHPRGRGVAATWKFPSQLWWEAACEATLDTPNGSTSKINQLIGELQEDRKQLQIRVTENLPGVIGGLAFPQSGLTPGGFVAWQRWENELDIRDLGIQLNKQIQFLLKVYNEKKESMSKLRDS